MPRLAGSRNAASTEWGGHSPGVKIGRGLARRGTPDRALGGQFETCAPACVLQSGPSKGRGETQENCAEKSRRPTAARESPAAMQPTSRAARTVSWFVDRALLFDADALWSAYAPHHSRSSIA